MGQLQVGKAELRGYTDSKRTQSKDEKETGDVFKSFLKDKTNEEQQVKPETKKEEDAGQTKEETPDEMLLSMQMAQMVFDMQKPDLPNEVILAPETVEAVVMDPETEVPLENAGVFAEAEGEMAAESLLNRETEVPEVLLGNPKDGQEKPAEVKPVEVKTAEAKPESGLETPELKETAAVPESRRPVEREKAKDTKQTVKTETKVERPETMEHPEKVVHEHAAVAHPVVADRVEPVTTEKMHVSNPEQIMEKLPERIIEKVSLGVREFEIQIEPEHLGKIAIKVLYDRGQTMISIACTEQKTMDMVEKNARVLGNVMERNLGTETTVVIEKKEPDYLQQNHEQERGDDRRQSEQERQREENRKNDTDESGQFLQRLRLGLAV